MPRGKGNKGGHKGQRRHFTNLEELEREKEKEERNRKWRAQRGEGDEDSEEGSGSEKESSEESSEAEEGDEEAKAKGVEHLIEVQNPNRAIQKAKKVAQIDEKDMEEAPQLSRREREELEKQKARQHYQKLHAAGKTDEARADLARLALIKKQREEQAKRRDDEKKVKEAEKQAKAESLKKALGKKT